VATLHVRKLVEEHGPTTAVAPRLRTSRQHDRGLYDAAREWHLDERTRKKAWHCVEIEAIGDLAERRGPRTLIELASGLHDASHRQGTEAEPTEETDRDGPIQREDRWPEGDSRRVRTHRDAFGHCR